MRGLGPFRCVHCGNRTRFDVFERLERRVFAHFDLAGEMRVEEEDVLAHDVLRVACRWCERDDGIEVLHEDRRRTTS